MRGRRLGLGTGRSSGRGYSECVGKRTNTKMCNHTQCMCSVSCHVNNHIFLKFIEIESKIVVSRGLGSG